MLSAFLNPWFSIVPYPFSDLGGPRASYPYVYNCGMMTVAVIMAAFSSYAAYASEVKLHVAGASLLGVAAIFLALIGYYHEGTYPHDFVSLWFFVQADIAVIVWAAGTLASGGSRITGAAEMAIGILGPVGAALIRWPPGASIEIYGIVLIDLAVGLITYDLLSGSS